MFSLVALLLRLLFFSFFWHPLCQPVLSLSRITFQHCVVTFVDCGAYVDAFRGLALFDGHFMFLDTPLLLYFVRLIANWADASFFIIRLFVISWVLMGSLLSCRRCTYVCNNLQVCFRREVKCRLAFTFVNAQEFEGRTTSDGILLRCSWLSVLTTKISAVLWFMFLFFFVFLCTVAMATCHLLCFSLLIISQSCAFHTKSYFLWLVASWLST